MLLQISFYIHVLHLRLDICLFYMSTTQMFCEMCEKRLQLCERSSIATRILRYEPVLYNLTSFVLLGPFFCFFLRVANKILHFFQRLLSRSLTRSHSVALLMALCMQIVFYLHTFCRHWDAYACADIRTRIKKY